MRLLFVRAVRNRRSDRQGPGLHRHLRTMTPSGSGWAVSPETEPVLFRHLQLNTGEEPPSLSGNKIGDCAKISFPASNAIKHFLDSSWFRFQNHSSNRPDSSLMLPVYTVGSNTPRGLWGHVTGQCRSAWQRGFLLQVPSRKVPELESGEGGSSCRCVYCRVIVYFCFVFLLFNNYSCFAVYTCCCHGYCPVYRLLWPICLSLSSCLCVCV